MKLELSTVYKRTNLAIPNSNANLVYSLVEIRVLMVKYESFDVA